jgi:hypothetical protein
VLQVSKASHRHSCFHDFARSWKSAGIGRSAGARTLDWTSENPYLKVSLTVTVPQPEDKAANPKRHAIEETGRKGAMEFPFCRAERLVGIEGS